MQPHLQKEYFSTKIAPKGCSFQLKNDVEKDTLFLSILSMLHFLFFPLIGTMPSK